MYVWDFAALKPYWGLIGQGLLVTLFYTVTTVVAGLAIGLFVGILRTTAPRWITVPLRLYIEVFRCTPLLVQLIWVYYALPVLIGVDMSPAMACFLALSLYAGSFYAEIFRGGIEAVDHGQWEAGRAIGMRRGENLSPHRALPPGNQGDDPLLHQPDHHAAEKHLGGVGGRGRRPALPGHSDHRDEL